MRLKALIFDVDGTLADTEEAHRQSFNAAFAQHGLDWSWSRREYGRLLETAGGKERIAAHLDSLALDAGERLAMEGRIGRIHRTKTDIYASLVSGGSVPLRDGVERLIDDAAAANVQLAIASTTTLANIEALLRSALGRDAVPRFAVIGAGDQVRRKKPAPEIYRFVMRELNRLPEQCVAIEDSPNGLASAKAAGLYTVVTPSDWTRGGDFSAADQVLPSLAGLGVRELDRQLDAIRAYQ